MVKAKTTRGGLDPAAVESARRVLVLDDPREYQSQVAATVRGIKPLWIHRFSVKTVREIESKQAGEAGEKKKRKARNPEQEFLDALHVIDEAKVGRPRFASKKELARFRYGVPAIGFLRAIMTVAKHDKIPGDAIMSGLSVEGDEDGLVEIISKHPPEMHTGHVRIARGIAHVCYRPIFRDWGAKIDVRFWLRFFSTEQVGQWLLNAGIRIGVGDNRRCGRFAPGIGGTFEIPRGSMSVVEMVEEERSSSEARMKANLRKARAALRSLEISEADDMEGESNGHE